MRDIRPKLCCGLVGKAFVTRQPFLAKMGAFIRSVVFANDQGSLQYLDRVTRLICEWS